MATTISSTRPSKAEAAIKLRVWALANDGEPGDGEPGDVGPATEALFAREIEGARTVVWNGPMGVFELAPFRSGTVALARAAAAATERGALTIVGGGDSAAAVEEAGVAGRITHISTGGGASLELLAGETLPGVAALTDA